MVTYVQHVFLDNGVKDDGSDCVEEYEASVLEAESVEDRHWTVQGGGVVLQGHEGRSEWWGDL